MTTQAATTILLIALVVTTVGASILIAHAEMRPPMALLGAGIIALILATTHFILGAFLTGRELRGLWAQGTIEAVPTTLGAVGATALSVWVAIWVADQGRLTAFSAAESASIYTLRNILLELQDQSTSIRRQWIGVQAPFVYCGEMMLAQGYDYGIFQGPFGPWISRFLSDAWFSEVDGILEKSASLEAQIHDLQYVPVCPQEIS